MTRLDVTEATLAPRTAAAEGDGPSSRPDGLAGRATTRADLLTAALVGLAVAALAVVFRSVVVPTDPWHYVRSALEFPSAAWVPLGYTRYGIILATIPVVQVFGNAQVSYYFWPVLSAGLLASAVYLLGRRWWGWVAGAVAVVLLFTNSVVFFNLSRGYPDVMSMALLMIAALCALAARDRMVQGRGAVLWLLAVGFCLGWGFEVRETSMLAWPLFALILWRRGSVLKTAALVTVPLAFWAALDVGISAWAYGDPWLKYHALTGIQVAEARTPTGELASTNVVGRSRWFYFSQIPLTAWQEIPDGRWMVFAGVVALIGLLVRNNALRLMAGWFLSVYVLNVLAAGGLDPSSPKGKLDIVRYWIQYIPPMALAAGGAVALAGAWLTRRLRLPDRPRLMRSLPTVLLAGLVCAGPAVFAAQYATNHVAFAPNGGDALEDLREHLRGQDFAPERVWTDWETKRILPAYQRDFFGGEKVWSGKPMSLTGKGEPQPGDYVLLFSAKSSTCSHCRTALKPWMKKHPDGPPANWRVEYTSETGNLVLYRVT